MSPLSSILILISILILLIIIGVRNHLVFKLSLRLLNEEEAFLRTNMNFWTGELERQSHLPSYPRMVLEFWVPLSHYEKLLSRYYNTGEILEEYWRLRSLGKGGG